MYQKIEELATTILKKLNINRAPVDIEAVVVKAGVIVKPYDLGDDVSGVLLIDKVKSVIGYNPSEHPVRRRFTIAHEFGHFLLHKEDSELFVDKEKKHFRNQDSTTGEFKKEREANYFAASILMPQYLIYKEAEERGIKFIDESVVKELAKIFNVSQQAMTIRLTNLNLLW